MMSEQLKLFLKLKKKKAEIERAENQMLFKPAQKNINFQVIDMITFNIMENMTKYKNREIDVNILNKELSINLSFILTKINPKKNPKKEENKINNKNNNIKDNTNKNKNKNNIINNFGIYFPISRITFMKENLKNNKNKKKDIKKFDVFLPLSQSFLNIKQTKNNDNSNSSDIDLKLYYKKNSKSKESSLLYEEENSISLISEDSLNNNKGLNENNKNKKPKESKKFVKYKELVDYYECPLLQNETKKEKLNNFINLLNNVDDIFGEEENFDFNYYIKNNNKEKIFIDNIDIIIANELKKDETLNNNNLKINIGIEASNIFDDSVFFNDKNNNLVKMKEISDSLRKKYSKKMNENYIYLLHKIYLRFFDIFSINQKTYKNLNVRTEFVKYFKQLLLRIGITNKSIYEKILKNQIFSDKILSFDKFIQSFDVIISDNNFENVKLKYLFLLNIITTREFLNWKKIEIFFELIGCYYSYVESFSENLGDKFIRRYNALYQNEEKNNILEKKYRLRKLIITLESFFDQMQSNE